ncbi:MAG: hypothetical protein EDM75_10650 [Chlorobiota bacterium]|nr:MAG: hypothetical protein EDM75_10650 [Chlorobiota bacterium]
MLFCFFKFMLQNRRNTLFDASGNFFFHAEDVSHLPGYGTTEHTFGGITLKSPIFHVANK